MRLGFTSSSDKIETYENIATLAFARFKTYALANALTGNIYYRN